MQFVLYVPVREIPDASRLRRLVPKTIFLSGFETDRGLPSRAVLPVILPPNTKTTQKVPRGCLSIFLLIFFFSGLGLGWQVMKSTWEIAQTYRWSKVDAEMLEARTVPSVDGATGPSLELRFRYQFKGRDYFSNQYERGHTRITDENDVYQLSSQLAPPTHTYAYVNPAKPEEAVLHRVYPWVAFTILMPLLFVAVPLIGLYFIWRRGPAGAISTGAKIQEAANKSGRMAMGIFALIFVLVGLGTSIPFFFKPLLQVNAAKTWPAVPCEIVSSRVQEHKGSKGSTYSIEVAYRYEINGRVYTSARYGFLDLSSSGQDNKSAVVTQLPVGARTVCYVDPSDPTFAVLDREFSAFMLIGAVPLLFVVLGVLGILYAIFGRMGKGVRSLTLGGQTVDWLKVPRENPNGELALASTRLGRLVGTLAFAFVWNSLTVATGWQFVRSWKAGQHQWGLGLFLIPFLAVGVVTLGYAFRTLLVQFNPRVRVKSNGVTVPLGGTLQISWNLDGRVEGLQNLRLTLEGREEATYRRGKGTRTERITFLTQEIANVTEQIALRSGSARVVFPASTMHSLNAANNRVVWTIRVTGKIPRWPDIDDEFLIVVIPTPLMS